MKEFRTTFNKNIIIRQFIKGLKVNKDHLCFLIFFFLKGINSEVIHEFYNHEGIYKI